MVAVKWKEREQQLALNFTPSSSHRCVFLPLFTADSACVVGSPCPRGGKQRPGAAEWPCFVHRRVFPAVCGA